MAIQFSKLGISLGLVLVLYAAAGRAENGFGDSAFNQGFWVKDLQPPHTLLGPLQAPGTVGDSIWDIAEWGSQSTMATYGGQVVPGEPNQYRWADQYKSVTVTTGPGYDFDLRLGINSFNEYGGVYPTGAYAWPHLLVGQRINKSHHRSIGQMASVPLTFEARLSYHNPNIQTGYIPSQHAGTFVMWFTIQNLRAGNAGFGDYLWLGFSIFDTRAPSLPQWSAIDTGNENKPGTGKLIYRIASNDVTSGTLWGGNWTQFNVDLVTHAKAALDYAWANGILQDSTNYSDYYIGGMNTGFEVHGMDVLNVDLRDMNLVIPPGC